MAFFGKAKTTLGKTKRATSATINASKDIYGKVVQGPRTNPFSFVFGFIFGLIKWVFFIGLTGILLILIYAFLTGGTQSGFFQYGKEYVSDTIQKVPILSTFVSQFNEIFKTAQDPSRIVRRGNFEATVDENSENEELGLKFENLKSLKQSYLKDDEEINLIATTKITTLDDKMKIIFTCKDKTSDINGKIDLGGGLQDQEEIEIQENSNQVFPVQCVLPLKENFDNGNIAFSSEQKIKVERIVLSADYNFKTQAYVEAYTMNSRLLKEKQYNEENPFKDEINSRLNKDTGEIKSKYSKGPIKVLINSEYSQPFTEQGPFLRDSYYNLRILAEQLTLSQGTLNKINNVYLYIPENFEILEDDKNDFEYDEGISNDYNEPIFKKYKLKNEMLRNINEYCDERRLSETECESYWKTGISLGKTKFKIVNLNQDELDKYFIRAEADYDFKLETSKTISIIKSFVQEE